MGNKELKVITVRYFETRRGLGYECQTNVKGLCIWNDGNGGSTYFSGDGTNIIGKDIGRLERIYSECDLEKMIDEYEGIKKKDREKIENK